MRVRIHVQTPKTCFLSQVNESCSWVTTPGRVSSPRASTALCRSLRSTSRTSTPWTTASCGTSTPPVCLYSGVAHVSMETQTHLFRTLSVGSDSGGGRVGGPGRSFPGRGSLRSQVWSRPSSHGRQTDPDGRSHQVRAAARVIGQFLGMISAFSRSCTLHT